MLKSLSSNKQIVYNKFHSALFLGLLLSPMTTINAAKIDAESSIKSVTVYPGSAKVTRVSKIMLTAGENDIVINNLPLNLNESSLRVSGEGEGSISLGSVELSRNIQYDVVQQQEKELRNRIEETQEQRQVIEDSITRNNAQLNYINKMVLGNNATSKRKDELQNGSYTNLPLDQWQQAWETLNGATEKVQEEIRQANKALKESNKQLNKLNRELQQVATNQKESRIAKLHIDADTATELTLNLSYQINGARWEPVYDADLNTETGGIELKTLAQISQRTGENWDGVDVTLSTLRPSAGTQLPQLNPWILDFMPDRRAGGSKMYESSVSMDTMVETSKAKMAPKPQLMKRSAPAPMLQQQSRLISADFSAEYKVPGTISLNSGSNKRRFALNTQKFTSTLKLASAPRLDPRAMILATSKYEDETPLLAGSMSLYRNGNFVGNTFLNQKLSGEEIKLSFGEDDKVKIKFLPDPDKKRKDGLLFGKKKVVERHYKISITSNHNKPFEISISDVLPVASDENIKVKNLGTLPTKKDVDDKEGIVSWDKTLAPKVELKINYGYSVSYPEDRTVLGL
ncbi:MAG: mucoidy inhibitor MuiA family protein [Cocleimonas sp.]